MTNLAVREFAKEAVEKAEDQLEKAQAKIAAAEARIKEFQTAINKYGVYFLSDSNKYALSDIDAKGSVVWTFIAAEAAAKFFNLLTTEDKRIFDGVLRELERIKLRSVNSFKPQPPDVLNLMTKDGWIEPNNGAYDPIFDVLMKSLSNGRQSVQDHIEKVLVYKFLHPECYKLPCITISGEGGVGKNDFIEQVLATIFGKQQIAVLGTEEAFGPFNGQMLGKTVVFIDEAISEQTNAESLKRKAGNETIQINMKYGIQGTYDNTPWYWLGGNGTNGAVFLAGDMTDRRYSVLTVDKSIMYWVGKHLGVTVATNDVLPDTHECVRWYFDHFASLTDREQVANWMGSIILKWHAQTSPPGALHDEDYKQVRHAQTSIIDDIVDAVFTDSKFEHIEAKTLYAMYKITMKDDNPSGKAKGKKKFLDDVHRIIKKRFPDVVYGKTNINDGSKKTSAIAFVRGEKTWFYRNHENYIVTSSRGIESINER